MNAALIVAGVQFVGMALSFMLLLRARRIAVGLWPTCHSYRRLRDVNCAKQSADLGRSSIG
jgi:hypothetical protein